MRPACTSRHKHTLRLVAAALICVSGASHAQSSEDAPPVPAVEPSAPPAEPSAPPVEPGASAVEPSAPPVEPGGSGVAPDAPPPVEASAPAAAARELEPGAPPLASQRYKAGIERYVRGDFAGAVLEFKVAQALAPRSPKLAYNLGRSLERTGDLDGAIAAYRAYLDRAPQAPDRAAVEQVIAVLLRERRPVAGAPESAPAPASGALGKRTPVSPKGEAGPSGRVVALWGTAGGALVSGIVGSVFAVSAAGAKSDAEALDPSDTERHERLQSDYGRGQVGAGIGLGLAGALAVTAVVLLLLPEAGDDAAGSPGAAETIPGVFAW